MFEIPTNSAKDLRPEVVDLVCQALFKKREMYWCDRSVNEDGTFRSDFSDERGEGKKSFLISEDERKAALERFRDKGYHIFHAQWCTPDGKRLYSYRLHEQKRINNGGGYYMF